MSSMDEFTKSGHLEAPRTRGRPFAQGNPGRKAGSKNKTTVIAQALPNGGLELVQTGVRAGQSRQRFDVEVFPGANSSARSFDTDRIASHGACVGRSRPVGSNH